jgi:long-chain acyl-CoA synthetase
MSGLATQLWAGITATATRKFMLGPDRVISYVALRDGLARWTRLFDAHGLKCGDRIVIRTDRDEVAAAAFLAALLDGVVPILLEGTCPDARLAAIIAAVDPKVVASDRFLPELACDRVVLERHAVKQGFFKRSDVPHFGLAENGAGRPPRLPADQDGDGLAYLLFTSGTTAAPAGVQISRANLAANLATLAKLFDYGSDSRIFNDMILAHADGMIQGPVLAAWTGSSVIRAGGFQVQRIEDWLAKVRQYRATHVLTVPTVWAMIDAYAAHDDYFDAPECKVLMSVAAKLPSELWDRIEARFRRPLVSHYGLTETVASALYAGDWPGLGARHSAGLPVDCAARIAGGAPQGELELQGDNVFAGYWRNPERSAASFTGDRWFRTGDLAERLENGSYAIVGRLKLVIMSGGLLIRPDEIDEAMLRHAAVLESATIACPDDVFGEIGVTAIVLRDGAEATQTDLAGHLRLQVEPHKVSKHVVILPAIPRGLSGKVNIAALRELVTAQLAKVVDPRYDNPDVAAAVLAIAARVFRVAPDSLSLRSAPDDVAGWDSFTHINLIMSVEQHFACRISARQVSGLRNLGDLTAVVSKG